jgi:zinc transporter ZupT
LLVSGFILGEILSNTITIGEPPKVIGSLLEMTGGFLAFISILILATNFVKKMNNRENSFLFTLSLLLFLGMIWWFTHPIDQSLPIAPSCIKDNIVYNLFHGPC